MRYIVENTLENLTLIRTISDSFASTETDRLFSSFMRYDTILLVIGEHPTPQFRFRDISLAPFLSEAELRELVFTLSLEQ